MRKVSFLMVIMILVSTFFVSAQNLQSLTSLKQKSTYNNLATTNVYDDSVVTTDVIWIKKEVKPHCHASHSEQVYVIEGTGQMLVGNQTYDVRPGDLITVPK